MGSEMDMDPKCGLTVPSTKVNGKTTKQMDKAS